jgi:hypothetical protein
MDETTLIFADQTWALWAVLLSARALGLWVERRRLGVEALGGGDRHRDDVSAVESAGRSAMRWRPSSASRSDTGSADRLESGEWTP